MKTDSAFYRGARSVSPSNHIVIVTLPNGGQVLRRASLNVVQMRAVEDSLMRLQHDGRIRGFVLAAAEDCTVLELLTWIGSLTKHATQPELLNVQQNTLFAGGGQ